MRRKCLFLLMAAALVMGFAACSDKDDEGMENNDPGAINKRNFPDAKFREWLLCQEYGADSVLTEEEIASITEIDVNDLGIQSLKGIEYFTALKYLMCRDNKLKTLDLSQNTKLNRLFCFNNQLTSLDISQNTALEMLDCGNNQLTRLDLSGCTVLKSLRCFDNQLMTLDLSHNTEITEVYCINNQLTTLDLSHNTWLGYLSCFGNQLTTLDVSQNKRLIHLYCYCNRIKGTGMDELVESLPTVSKSNFRVIYNENEKNVMTTQQVAAAKAKGWNPYYFDGKDWKEYVGSNK